MVEQRKAKRFTLNLPVAVTRAGSQRTAQAGFTLNISSGGVLFTSGTELAIGYPIEYVITLADTSVNLRCMGKVMRNERVTDSQLHDGPSYEVAATLERYEFLRHQA